MSLSNCEETFSPDTPGIASQLPHRQRYAPDPTHTTRSAPITQIPPGSRNATSGCWSVLYCSGSSSFCRSFANVSSLRCWRSMIGIADLRRVVLSNLEKTDLGTVLGRLRTISSDLTRTQTHRHTNMVISETGESHACLCVYDSQYPAIQDVQLNGLVINRNLIEIAEEASWGGSGRHSIC